jgi:hypothetical protein
MEISKRALKSPKSRLCFACFKGNMNKDGDCPKTKKKRLSCNKCPKTCYEEHYEQHFQEKLREKEARTQPTPTKRKNPAPRPTYDKDDPPDSPDVMEHVEPTTTLFGDAAVPTTPTDFAGLPADDKFNFLYNLFREQHVQAEGDRQRAKEELKMVKRQLDAALQQNIDRKHEYAELKDILMTSLNRKKLESNEPIREEHVTPVHIPANDTGPWCSIKKTAFKYAVDLALPPDSSGGAPITVRGILSLPNRFQALHDLPRSEDQGISQVYGGPWSAAGHLGRQANRHKSKPSLNPAEMDNVQVGLSSRAISPMVTLYFEGMKRNRITEIKSFIKTLGIPLPWVRNVSFIGKCVMEIDTFEDKRLAIISKLATREIKWLEHFNPRSPENLRDERKFSGKTKEEKEALAIDLYEARIQKTINRLPKRGEFNRYRNFLNSKIRPKQQTPKRGTSPPLFSASPLAPPLLHTAPDESLPSPHELSPAPLDPISGSQENTDQTQGELTTLESGTPNQPTVEIIDLSDETLYNSAFAVSVGGNTGTTLGKCKERQRSDSSKEDSSDPETFPGKPVRKIAKRNPAPAQGRMQSIAKLVTGMFYQ